MLAQRKLEANRRGVNNRARGLMRPRSRQGLGQPWRVAVVLGYVAQEHAKGDGAHHAQPPLGAAHGRFNSLLQSASSVSMGTPPSRWAFA